MFVYVYVCMYVCICMYVRSKVHALKNVFFVSISRMYARAHVHMYA